MNAGAALNDIRWTKPEHVERRVASLERRIRDFVDSAPPLTREQADRLASLLRSAEAGSQT